MHAICIAKYLYRHEGTKPYIVISKKRYIFVHMMVDNIFVHMEFGETPGNHKDKGHLIAIGSISWMLYMQESFRI